jgi:hypothetical protein
MKYKQYKQKKFINSLLHNFDDEEANNINSLNEKSLSKELKNILLNNKKNNITNNIKGSGSVLKRKPINTLVLINNVSKK